MVTVIMPHASYFIVSEFPMCKKIIIFEILDIDLDFPNVEAKVYVKRDMIWLHVLII